MGTPSSIPKNPNNPPPIRIENNTQKGGKPIESPRIRGPNMFPSNCCRIITKITNGITALGFARRTSKPLGIAPIIGPKNGITFVTPIITLIRTTNGIFKKVSPIKHNNPIINDRITSYNVCYTKLLRDL